MSILSAIKHNSSVLSLVKHYNFGQNQPIKIYQIFEIFECLGQNLLNSSCQFCNGKSVLFQIFHHSSLTHKSSLTFKLTHFLLCIKGSNESRNFENFVSSGGNLSDSTCDFPNQHWFFFFQILYNTLVSWNIAPLYFFSWNIIYVGKKQPIKVSIFETFEFSSLNSSNPWCRFWKGKSIPLQIFHHSSVPLLITPL